MVQYAYGRLGITLPRVAEDQAKVGQFVPREQLQPGDALFFADSSGYIHHEGLYIGNNKMIHSPKTGDRVKISDITSAYYTSQYAGARRYSPSTQTGP
jgi:cell wall-associated NlpC family hydrolase